MCVPSTLSRPPEYMLESLVLPTSVLDEPEQLPYDPRPPDVGVVPSGPFLYHGHSPDGIWTFSYPLAEVYHQ